MDELTVDPNAPARLNVPALDEDDILTGILVRAKHDGKWGNWDIAFLDEPSLTRWLKSRGGDNLWAESTVRTMLGHR